MTVKKKKPKSKKKIIKLLTRTNKEHPDKIEWMERQIKSLNDSEKAIVITIDKAGILRTGYYYCMFKDILYMCDTLKHEVLMENYE